MSAAVPEPPSSDVAKAIKQGTGCVVNWHIFGEYDTWEETNEAITEAFKLDKTITTEKLGGERYRLWAGDWWYPLHPVQTSLPI